MPELPPVQVAPAGDRLACSPTLPSAPAATGVGSVRQGYPGTTTRPAPLSVFVHVAGLLFASACVEERSPAPAVPVYAADVEFLLQAHCQDCHLGDNPAAGYRLDDYLGTIGCSESRPNSPLTQPPAPRAPLLWTLRFDPDHAPLLRDDALATVEAWVVAGAPLRARGIHGPNVLRPGAAGFHGALAIQDRLGPLTDDDHPWACGQCHHDAPAGGAPRAAPADATPCSDCHRASEGALACDTCHGAEGRAYPPRDPCFHPDDAGGAHGAHLSPDAPMPFALACTSCHPPADTSFTASHGNGRVDVRLSLPDALPAPDTNAYTSNPGRDRAPRCAVYCHNRGGAHPTPGWFEANVAGCNGCHGSPPANHYAGACSECHRQANAEGTALTTDAAPAQGEHLNGQVDIGDGSTCGGCHDDRTGDRADGGEPWPDTPSHRAHRDTLLTTSIACETCHSVPASIIAEGHLDRGTGDPADVALDPAVAASDSAPPRYEDGRCANIRCHGDGDDRFRWDTAGPALDCATCHGAPPPPPHAQDTGCAQLLCHGGDIGFDEAGQPRISDAGRNRHIDGVTTGGP